jgi:predicted acyl esterase
VSMDARDPNAKGVSRRGFAATLIGAAGWLALPRTIGVRVDEAAPDYTLLSDVMVTMRDGVRLATDSRHRCAGPVGTAIPRMKRKKQDRSR